MTDPKIITIGGQGGFGGLYNVMFGDGNEVHRIMLVVITTGMQRDQLARPRDAWVEKDGDDIRYALYTRLGGNNRPDYAESIAYMQANPHYLSDKDDTFDNTYATFYFRVPERLPDDATEENQKEWAGMRANLLSEAVEQVDMDELWQAGIEKMNDPEYAEALLEKSGLGPQLEAAFADITAPEEGKE